MKSRWNNLLNLIHDNKISFSWNIQLKWNKFLIFFIFWYDWEKYFILKMIFREIELKFCFGTLAFAILFISENIFNFCYSDWKIHTNLHVLQIENVFHKKTVSVQIWVCKNQNYNGSLYSTFYFRTIYSSIIIKHISTDNLYFQIYYN